MSRRPPGRGAGAAGRARGQSLVEFSLILPLFLLAFFGLIDGARLVYFNSTLSQAVREAARTGAVEAYWLGSTAGGLRDHRRTGLPGDLRRPSRITSSRRRTG